jgi:hypothetical protein
VYVPAGHSVQLEAPASEYLPAKMHEMSKFVTSHTYNQEIYVCKNLYLYIREKERSAEKGVNTLSQML